MQIQEIIKLDIVQNFIRSLVQLELHMLGENEAIKAVTLHVKMLCEDPVWSCLAVKKKLSICYVRAMILI